MKKQYYSAQIASLLNPPLLSKFQQFQKDSLENVYASKKYPLGRSKLSALSETLANKKFGINTGQDDSASILIYPSNQRILRSIYADEFLPLNCLHLNEVPAAGLYIGGKCLTDNTGTEMKQIFNEVTDAKSTASQNNIKNIEDANNLPYVSNKCDDYSNLVVNKQSVIQKYKPSLLDALWKLLEENSYLNPTEFASFLKAYVNNFPQTFTFVDLQRILKHFGAYISLPILENALKEFNVFDDAFINKEKFLQALKQGFNVTRKCTGGDKKFLLSYPCDDLEHFKTTSSVIGDHKSAVSSNKAGIPIIRKDIKKPELGKFTDITEYGDVRDASIIIQPSLFEKYGVYEEDLGALRSKEEMKSILYKSGISFNDEMFNLVWNKVSKMGHASIGKIWNNLKNLCLSENKLFV